MLRFAISERTLDGEVATTDEVCATEVTSLSVHLDLVAFAIPIGLKRMYKLFA